MSPRPRKRRQYGTGSVYERQDGRWIGVVKEGTSRNGTRQRITVSAKSEAEVKRKLRDKRAQIEREGRASSGRMTVKAWADKWLERTALTVRPSTHTTDKGAVRAYIVPAIGQKRLDQLEPDDVRAVSAAIRKAGQSSTTARRYHNVLIRMLKAAVLDGHQVAGRVLTTEKPIPAVTDRKALTTPEALAMLQAAAFLPHGSRWVAAFLQGMRQAECLGLTWPEVDLDAGYLTVSWQLQSLPYIDPHDKRRGFLIPDGFEARQLVKAAHLVRPKTQAGWRVIPLVPQMRNMLESWRAVGTQSPHGLVWPAIDGDPANIRHDTWEWQALQGTANVGHPAGRYYYGHEARNTTATLLVELDVDESIRIAIMGHSSIRTTRGYEAVSRARSLAALEKVAERLGLD